MIKRKVEPKAIKKIVKPPLGAFNSTQGARGYFLYFAKLRTDFNEKGILYLIDPDVEPPSPAHKYTIFRKTEAIIGIVVENWKYYREQADEDAPSIAKAEVTEESSTRVDDSGEPMPFTQTELREEIKTRIIDVKKRLLAPYTLLNAHKWDTSDYNTEAKDETFCQNVLALLTPVFLGQANQAISFAQQANNKVNETYNKAIQTCLKELSNKLRETMDLTGSSQYMRQLNFIEVMRQHTKHFLNQFKMSDLTTSEERFTTIVPTGYDLTESLTEIKEVFSELALMRHVNTLSQQFKTAQDEWERPQFDIDWIEIEANSWSLTDGDIEALPENNFGKPQVVLSYYHRLAALKRFMSSHPFTEFRNQVIQFGRDSEINVEKATFDRLIYTYLESAQKVWNEMNLPIESTGESSAKARAISSFQPEQLSSRRKRHKGVPYGTYALPPQAPPMIVGTQPNLAYQANVASAQGSRPWGGTTTALHGSNSTYWTASAPASSVRCNGRSTTSRPSPPPTTTHARATPKSACSYSVPTVHSPRN